MLTLFHHTMIAGCRHVRLILGEYGEEISLIEEKPWVRRKEFLQINPAGTLPLLLAEHDAPIPGAMVIAEYLDETRGALLRGKRLFADDPFERAEIRRLCEWYLVKCEAEVTRHMVRERVFKPMMPAELGGGSPEAAALRAARANVRQHMKYTNWLAANRNWLAGPSITYADMAAGAAISILDYLGEIEWNDYPAARDWYARLKSRPAFRPLLTERVQGLPPVSHYPDPDF